MYPALLHTHSLLRYALLALPIAIILSLLINRDRVLKKRDEKLVLWSMIVAHMQFLIGILLLFTSPYVQFGRSTMKNAELRYWSMEHGIMMVIAVVLITLARVYSRKPIDDKIKYRRVLILMATSLTIILVTISMSGRGIFMPA